MEPGTKAARETGNERNGGGRRRLVTAGRALVVLVILNVLVLAAFAIERRSRSAWMSASLRAMPGGQPSTTHPSAGP